MPYKDPEKAKQFAKEYREKNKEKQSAYYKEWRKLNKEKQIKYKQEYYKDKRFNKYGISKAYFEELLDKQEHSCAICFIPFSEETRPYIDHCHSEGNVRGLLCMNCNTGLGHFKDNPMHLFNAIDYLGKDID